MNSIFRNLSEKENFGEEQLAELTGGVNETGLEKLSPTERDDFWDIVLYAAQHEEEILHSIHSLEFSHLAKFSFNLCQKLNGYYHKYSILAEKDRDVKNIRILTIFYIRSVLESMLSLMGIPKPERM